MGKNNNIIEINGKPYDAKTGESLMHHKSIINKSNQAAPKTKDLQKPIKLTPETNLSKPTMKDVVRKPAKQIKHHAPKPSHTLMRHSVKKPKPTVKRLVKAQGPTEQQADLVIPDAPAIPIKSNTKTAKLPKSNLITHFASIEPDGSQLAPAPLPAVPIPENAAPQIALKKNAKAQTTSELLERALQNANSHEQDFPKKSHRKRSKSTKVAVASLAVLLIAFVGYQEIPTIKLNVASAKAGFNAGMPGYKPPGYSLGDLNYSPGIVATTFNSNSDDRKYTLTQKTSTWDSQALLDNFIKPMTKDYQTVANGGRTIYIYGDSNATWVNGGVWYVVQTNGSLTNTQLTDLAKSL